MSQPLSIIWFRQDLRLSDNPALNTAAKNGTVLPIYILDDTEQYCEIGSASRWWLYRSLQSLNKRLNYGMMFLKGEAKDILPALAARVGATSVFWNRCYEPWRIERDSKIKKALRTSGIHAESFNGSLLWEPWTIKKSDGQPYKVFTAYYRSAAQDSPMPRAPKTVPKHIEIATLKNDTSLDGLELLPKIDWYRKFDAIWGVGEEFAHKRLNEFIDRELVNYKQGRDFPALDNVSRLSAHLHFGEISPNQVWYSAKSLESNTKLYREIEHFLRELCWREFSYYLLYHFPTLPRENFRPKFDNFPWSEDQCLLRAWQRGQTGYPIVDAGMRELWETGYMHNRVRMIVASFLVKNLMIHWRHGEDWFWDCLLDADLANNSASWQWVAGSGADAAPYFRIFNPVLQGEKFDAEGNYVRSFMPELNRLPNRYIHRPWNASEDILTHSHLHLGVDYPLPIVDLKHSRALALEAFKSLNV